MRKKEKSKLASFPDRSTCINNINARVVFDCDLSTHVHRRLNRRETKEIVKEEITVINSQIKFSFFLSMRPDNQISLRHSFQ